MFRAPLPMSRLPVLTTYCSMSTAFLTSGPATMRVKELCSAAVAVASNAVAAVLCRCRRVSRVVPALKGLGIVDRNASARLVTFVLQGLHQAGDLLSEVGELRHAAELGCTVGRGRDPQAAEDQAHGERQDEHREQPPRHRPVPQREGL